MSKCQMSKFRNGASERSSNRTFRKSFEYIFGISAIVLHTYIGKKRSIEYAVTRVP